MDKFTTELVSQSNSYLNIFLFIVIQLKLEQVVEEACEQLKELDPLREKLKKVEEKEEKSEQLIKTLKLEAEQNEKFWQEELEKMKIEFGKQIADLQKTIELQAEQVRLTFSL
jgi:hypothetical protein